MAQVTIYMDDETEARTREAARKEGVSLSRWIALVLRHRLASAWPPDVAALAGAWGQGDEPSTNATGADIPREPL